MRPDQQSHTFTRRPAITQIIAYIVVLADCLIFFITMQPNIESESSRITLIVFFTISYIGLIITAIITSCTDASDRFLKEDNNSIRRRQEGKNAYLFCQLCRSVVKEQTRHCKTCNLCIEQFDHHCIWINNCIGKFNYKSFISMLLFLIFNFSVTLSSLLVLWNQSKWQYFLISMIMNWTFSLILLIFTLLITCLLIFHFYLISIGKTTFNYLMDNKNKNAKISPQKIQIIQKSQTTSHHQMKLKTQTFVSFDSQQHLSKLKEESIIQKTNFHFPFQKNNQTISNQGEASLNLNSNGNKQEEIAKQILDDRSEERTEGNSSIKKNKSMEYLLGRIDVEVTGWQSQIYFQTQTKIKPKVQISNTGPLKVKRRGIASKNQN